MPCNSCVRTRTFATSKIIYFLRVFFMCMCDIIACLCVAASVTTKRVILPGCKTKVKFDATFCTWCHGTFLSCIIRKRLFISIVSEWWEAELFFLFCWSNVIAICAKMRYFFFIFLFTVVFFKQQQLILFT